MLVFKGLNQSYILTFP